MQKYNFSVVVGNEQLVGDIQHRVSTGRMPHAVLLCGARGTGKSLVAMATAKLLNCEAAQGGVACSRCASCVSLEAGTHPDTHVLGRGGGQSIGVEAIRKLLAEASLKPYRYPFKVFIIEEAGHMPPAAQNALLKTLEEPPNYAVFFLTTALEGSILPTIRSRCARYTTSAVGDDDVLRVLERGLPPQEAIAIAPYAKGSIGRAITMAEDAELRQMHAYVPKLLADLNECSMLELLGHTKALELFKHRIEDFLEIVHGHYSSEFVNAVLVHGTKAAGGVLPQKLDAIDTARARLQASGNFNTVIDALLLKLHDGKQMLK